MRLRTPNFQRSRVWWMRGGEWHVEASGKRTLISGGNQQISRFSFHEGGRGARDGGAEERGYQVPRSQGANGPLSLPFPGTQPNTCDPSTPLRSPTLP
mmetsp:Transcript_4934/g.10506  ORF Transcript_4934/g.10506 Transcript_4934/m.10506 type:complete len:98 (-) Transcript_4934:265-558(-)